MKTNLHFFWILLIQAQQTQYKSTQLNIKINYINSRIIHQSGIYTSRPWVIFMLLLQNFKRHLASAQAFYGASATPTHSHDLLQLYQLKTKYSLLNTEYRLKLMSILVLFITTVPYQYLIVIAYFLCNWIFMWK